MKATSVKVEAWQDCLGNLHKTAEAANKVNALENFKDWYDREWDNQLSNVDAAEMLEWMIFNKNKIKETLDF